MLNREVLSDLIETARRKTYDTCDRYNTVHVLLVSWEEDDLKVIDEVEELEKVFDRTYGFCTERYQIPSDNSQLQATRRWIDFLDHAKSKKDLLIIYYAGHGGEERGELLWHWYVSRRQMVEGRRLTQDPAKQMEMKVPRFCGPVSPERVHRSSPTFS